MLNLDPSPFAILMCSSSTRNRVKIIELYGKVRKADFFSFLNNAPTFICVHFQTGNHLCARDRIKWFPIFFRTLIVSFMRESAGKLNLCFPGWENKRGRTMFQIYQFTCTFGELKHFRISMHYCASWLCFCEKKITYFLNFWWLKKHFYAAWGYIC